MWNSILIAGCIFLGQPAESADSTRSELAAQVQRLERQLNADFLGSRDAAEKQLMELGPQVLDFLSPITPRTPAEVQQRLARIRKALELQLGEAVVDASPVTRNGEMSIRDALAAIANQTGNRITGHERRAGTVTVSFDKTPFWQALDQVLDQAQLNVQGSSSQAGQLEVVARPDAEIPRSLRAGYNGVFRFEPIEVRTFRNLRNPGVSGMKLTLQIAWEPKVKPISLAFPHDELKLFGEDGERLPVAVGAGEQEANLTPLMTAVELDLPFGLPDRSVKQIAKVTGTMTAMILGREEPFTFSALDGARNIVQQKSGATVTLQQIRKNLALTEVRLRVKFDEAENALESHRTWALRNRAYMLDADGQVVDAATEEAFLLGEDEIGRVYLFDLEDDLNSYKFVYTTPGTIVKKPIAFELKGFELP